MSDAYLVQTKSYTICYNRPSWILNYFAIALSCDFPILEAYFQVTKYVARIFVEKDQVVKISTADKNGKKEIATRCAQQ